MLLKCLPGWHTARRWQDIPQLLVIEDPGSGLSWAACNHEQITLLDWVFSLTWESWVDSKIPSWSKGQSLLWNVLGPSRAWSLCSGHVFSRELWMRLWTLAFSRSVMTSVLNLWARIGKQKPLFTPGDSISIESIWEAGRRGASGLGGEGMRCYRLNTSC